MSCNDCGFSDERREFLKKGGLGLATGFFGLSLVNKIFLEEAYGITPDATAKKYDALIQIFYDGGPSQTDTWDPKPGSTSNVFNTVNLGSNDIYGRPFLLSEVFSTLAGIATSDPMIGIGTVRSLAHGNGDHTTAQRWMNCFWQSPVADLYPSTASSMMHYLRDQAVNKPGAVLINGSNGSQSNTPKGGATPPAFQVFDVNTTRQMLSRPTNVDTSRYQRRRALIEAFNATFLPKRPDPLARTWDDAWKQAYDITQAGEAAAAFDLTGKTLLTGGANASGTHLRNLTLAQELVKAGIPYVSLGIGGNDSHDNNMATIRRIWGDNTDVPLAQMVQNLKASGKRVLIVMGGEFGRTPNTVASGRDGRDHWPDGFSWGLISVNQPAFRTVGVGDTGPDGLFREAARTLIDPVAPGALGAMLYKVMGYPVGSFTVPTAIGNRPPVDATIATNTNSGGGAWLTQQFGLA